MGDYFFWGKAGVLSPPDHSGSWTRRTYWVTKTPYTGLRSLPSTTTNLRLKKGVTRKLTNQWETRDRHVSVHLLRSWCERKPRKKLAPKMVIERVYSQLRTKSSHLLFNSFSTTLFFLRRKAFEVSMLKIVSSARPRGGAARFLLLPGLTGRAGGFTRDATTWPTVSCSPPRPPLSPPPSPPPMTF